MFSITESNVIKIVCAPVDMRMGVNSMCGHVRSAGNNPSGGTVYAFVGKGRNLMKLLHWERGGYVVYYKVTIRNSPSPYNQEYLGMTLGYS